MVLTLDFCWIKPVYGVKNPCLCKSYPESSSGLNKFKMLNEKSKELTGFALNMFQGWLLVL